MNDAKSPPHPPHDHAGRERLWSAICYLGPGCVVSSLFGSLTPAHRWDVAQGFVLFFAEAVALAILALCDATVGRIPVLGFLVMLVLYAGFFVSFFVLSVLGVVKSLAGEKLEIAVLERYARRIPIVHDDEISP